MKNDDGIGLTLTTTTGPSTAVVFRTVNGTGRKKRSNPLTFLIFSTTYPALPIISLPFFQRK